METIRGRYLRIQGPQQIEQGSFDFKVHRVMIYWEYGRGAAVIAYAPLICITYLRLHGPFPLSLSSGPSVAG